MPMLFSYAPDIVVFRSQFSSLLLVYFHSSNGFSGISIFDVNVKCILLVKWAGFMRDLFSLVLPPLSLKRKGLVKPVYTTCPNGMHL